MANMRFQAVFGFTLILVLSCKHYYILVMVELLDPLSSLEVTAVSGLLKLEGHSTSPALLP